MPTRTFHKERDVKAEIKKILDRHGWTFRWMPAANGYGKAGVSDFCVLKDGTFMAIEAKYAGRKPTPLQIQFLNNVFLNDGFGFVVDETRLEALDTFLRCFATSAARKATGSDVSPDDGAAMLDAIQAMTVELTG